MRTRLSWCISVTTVFSLLFSQTALAVTPHSEVLLQPNGEAVSKDIFTFIENVGQFQSDVQFFASTQNGSIWVTDNGIWVTYVDGGQSDAITLEDRSGINIKISFPGSKPVLEFKGNGESKSHYSFFYDNQPENWRSEVPAWTGIYAETVYPNIDLEITSVDGELIPAFILQEGADIKDVQMRIEGAEEIRLEKSNQVILQTRIGDFTLPLPITKELDGTAINFSNLQPTIDRSVINFPFSVSENSSDITPVGIEPQVFTPSLLMSSFLGGSSNDYALANAVDSQNSQYVIGGVLSTNFPVTPGVFNVAQNGNYDAFIAKFLEDGSLNFATYLGGYSSDGGWDIAVDTAGNVHALGFTASPNFPITGSALQPTLRGYSIDMFFTVLGPAGNILSYSTYFGGSSSDCYYSNGLLIYGLCSIALESSGNVYVAGSTQSTDFTTTSLAYDRTFAGNSDAFVTKFNKNGSSYDLAYSTFLGGQNWDAAYGISLYEGNVYVTGLTESTDFPTTNFAYDRTHNGLADGFVAKINSQGSALIYSTYLGGSQNDHAFSVVTELQGQAFITGLTNSTNFPVTTNSFDATFNGATDAFVTRLSVDGSRVIHSTYIGGSADDRGMTIWAGGGELVVGGTTYSTNFPTSSRAYDATHNGDADAFVISLDYTLKSRGYSTYLGGSSDECFSHVLNRAMVNCDLAGPKEDETEVFFIGYTESFNYPVTIGAFDTTFNGVVDAFTSKLDFREVPDTVPVFRQDVGEWASDPYGRYPDDDNEYHWVKTWGCFMTSATMAVNFFGSQRQPEFAPTPRDFNSWLRANQGYTEDNEVIHSKIIEYAMLNGVPLKISGGSSNRDDQLLNSILDKGGLAIIGVNNNGHYVLATGRTTINNQNVYLINDPLFGATTLEIYGNSYGSILGFTGAGVDKGLLYISAHSPVEFVVTDPLGRKTGYDPISGITWNQIPGALYFVNTLAPNGGSGTSPSALRAPTFMLLEPLGGNYRMEVIGTGTGGYDLLMAGSNIEGYINQTTKTGSAVLGSIDTFNVTFISQFGLSSTVFLPAIRR